MLRRFMTRALLVLLALVGVNANAAITFVGAGTPTTGTGTSQTVAYPVVTINANDLLIVHCFSSGLTSCTSSGFTATTEQEGGGTANQEVLWKRAAGGETGTVTVAQSGGNLKMYVLLVYRGVVAAGTPYEGLSNTTLADTTTATPDVVTTGADRVVVEFTSKDSAAATPAQPSGWTDRVNANTTTSTDATIHVFDQAAPTATTVTGPDVTYVSANQWFAHGLALIPEPGGGGGGGSGLLLRRRRG